MENITDFPLKNTDFSQNKGFSVTAEVSEEKDPPAKAPVHKSSSNYGH